MKRVLDFFRSQPIWAILLGIIVGTTIFRPDFLSIGNLMNILRQSAVNGMLAIGMTFLMINGYFDLSVGTVMGFAAALAIGFQPLGIGVAVAIAILAGAAIGA